jgi:iron complex transport system ATP-binding protein
LASEFADKILFLKSGECVAQGFTQEVLTAENLQKVFDVEVLLDGHPASGKLRITMNYEN